MATESLIVELDAKTSKLEEKLNQVDKNLNKLSKTSEKTNTGLGKISKVSSAVTGGIGKITSIAKKATLAFIGLQAAVVGVAKVAAAQAKEIKNAAALTKVSVEEMQALAFATSSVGINMEKLSDISKDTSEKIGDFINTGGGGFQDFADAMHLTTQQASDMAKSFQGLSGTDILKEMTSRMEGAGVSAEQMSHALEGMASDTTNLIPLLINGGEKLNELKDKFTETSVVLSQTDITKLGEMATNFSILGDTFKGTMGKFSVEYEDTINSMISSTQDGLKIIGDEFASGSFTDRLNSFYDAFAGSWSDAMGDNTIVFDNFTGDAKELITSLSKAWLDMALTLPINIKIAGMRVRELFFDIIDEVIIKLAELNVKIQEGLDFFGQGDLAGAQQQLDSIQEQIKARDNYADSEIAALQRQREARLEAFDEEQQQATVKREQYATDSKVRMDLAEKEDKLKRKLASKKLKSNKVEKKDNEIVAKARFTNTKTSLQTVSVLNKAFFNDNKALNAGLIVADTASTVMSEYKKGSFPAAALALATGAAQLAALKSSSIGGGTIGGVGGGEAQQPQNTFNHEASSLDLTTQTGDTNQTIKVVFSTDDGNDFFDMVGQNIQDSATQGRI